MSNEIDVFKRSMKDFYVWVGELKTGDTVGVYERAPQRFVHTAKVRITTTGRIYIDDYKRVDWSRSDWIRISGAGTRFIGPVPRAAT